MLSRFEARRAAGDSIILYDQQNEELWGTALIRQGMHFLECSAKGDEISVYHLEARIAYWHCIKEDTPEKWGEIFSFYDQLLKINYSPSVALNRIYALYKKKGAQAALPAAEQLNLEENHFYFVLLGELTGDSDPEKQKAILKSPVASQNPIRKAGYSGENRWSCRGLLIRIADMGDHFLQLKTVTYPTCSYNSRASSFNRFLTLPFF